MPKKYNTEEFIKKSKLIHGDKYDYSLVKYVGALKYVKIIYDGIIYEQTPSSHLSNLCPEKRCKKLNTESFIEKSKEIHGDKYDYSLTEYKNRFEYVKIIYDGIIYEQTPSLNLLGCCPEKKEIRKTTEEFINKSKKIYEDKYDYSLTEYINKFTKVKICYKGVVYEQLPRYHFKKCPELTGKSNGEEIIKNYLKINNIKYKKEYTYENCKNKIKLRYDYYLPDFNLLIEYDGIQHFKPIEYFGGEYTFNSIIENDNIKNIYAKENNIKLLRIKYLDIDNIDIILKKYL